MKIKKILLAFMSFGIVGLFAQGSIEGIIKDENGKVVPFATISVYQGENLIGGVAADLDGYYFMDNLKEGKYEVKVSNVDSKATFSVNVKDRETLAFNPEIKEGIEITGVTIGVTKETTFFRRDAPNIVIRDEKVFTETKKKDLAEMLTLEKGTTEDKEGNISFRGSRPGQGAYYVDGMRINGKLGIPTSAIYTMEIYNGGIPAKYGNTTSAVISITTKSYFDFFD